MFQGSRKPCMVNEAIGVLLLRRLQEIGISHVFGVAGDFNLELLEQLEANPNLKWVGCCNELNAAYAADGYARTHGIAALVTTYGVGELSALCGIAGAYAEHLAIIAITGAPPLSEIIRKSILHNTVGEGNFNDMAACGREFSAAHARLTPQNAANELDRCIRTCILEKRPVYIQLPCDLAYVCVDARAAPISAIFQSDARMLADFTNAATQLIAASMQFTILADADVARFGHVDAMTRLSDKLGCSIAVMGTAKGLMDETHPAYLGVYSGVSSAPNVRQGVESAECLLRLAVRFVDSTTGSFSERISPKRSIEIGAWQGSVDQDHFQGVYMGDMLDRLVATTEQRQSCRSQRSRTQKVVKTDGRISQPYFWKRMESFVCGGDIVVTESGTSLLGVAGMDLPAGCRVICQALWNAIGYSLPATFGSLVAAPGRRHLLFIGDGSFQLTVQELSSILRHRFKPVIFLINNDGYTMERPSLGPMSSHYDVQPWKYVALCDVFAGGAEFDSRRVTSVSELEAALVNAEDGEKCFFIEVVMARLDAPTAFKEYGAIYASQDYGANVVPTRYMRARRATSSTWNRHRDLR